MRVAPADIEKWRKRLEATKSPSTVLREMASAYGVRRDDVSFMLLDISKASLDELQLVWNWDFSGTGKGFSDADLDKRLEKLTDGTT
jgi:hypothetical protein